MLIIFVLEFMAEVESIRHNLLHSPEIPPIVVHCSAGVGRTGVFILADLMIAHLQNQTRQVCFTLLMIIINITIITTVTSSSAALPHHHRDIVVISSSTATSP